MKPKTKVALFDFLKNKKDKEKAAEKKAVAVDAKKVSRKLEIKEYPVAPKNTSSSNKFSYTVVRDPHISEKANDLAQKNKYTFKVYEKSNKLEIKKSIEGIYGVDVLAVNIITIPHKKRRLGKTEGFRKGYKKALVTIKEGQKIEVY